VSNFAQSWIVIAATSRNSPLSRSWPQRLFQPEPGFSDISSIFQFGDCAWFRSGNAKDEPLPTGGMVSVDDYYIKSLRINFRFTISTNSR